MILVIIILVIIIIWWFYKNPIYKTHTYWDVQPVSRNQSNDGYITSNFPKPIIPTTIDSLLTLKTFHPHQQSELERVTEFINQHYIYKYHYTPEFIKWTVLSPNSNPKHNLLLYYNNNLVGSIFARSMDIIVHGIQIPLYYVDFLCIHKEYRKKGWAPILISNIVDVCTTAVYQSFIFKIEKYPLPFNYMSKCNYYYKKIKSYTSNHKLDRAIYTIKRTSIATLTECYRFFNKHTKKYKIYPFFSKLEFMYYFMPSIKIGSCYELRNKHNNIIGILFFSVNYYKSGSGLSSIADLQYIFTDDPTILFPFLDSILVDLSNAGYEFISITSIMNHRQLIKEFRFQQSMTFYYQMYNYHLRNSLLENEIALNIP
jgi:hypothetical protein